MVYLDMVIFKTNSSLVCFNFELRRKSGGEPRKMGIGERILQNKKKRHFYFDLKGKQGMKMGWMVVGEVKLGVNGMETFLRIEVEIGSIKREKSNDDDHDDG